MAYDPLIHHRKSIRLKGLDYAQPGMYFVTVVVKNRECLFGENSNVGMTLHDGGFIVQSVWRELPVRFPNAILDEFVVMLNHFHGIIGILDSVGAWWPRPQSSVMMVSRPDSTGAGRPRPYAGIMPSENNLAHPLTLGQMIAFFKYQTTKRINQIRGTSGASVWQRNYYNRSIRKVDDLARIRKYIQNNPKKCETDDENSIHHVE